MAELLADQLRLMAGHLPDEVALSDVTSDDAPEADLTFGAWERQSNQMARWLVGQGVRRGDRVAIHLPPEEAAGFAIAYTAAHKAGAAAVPTNTRLVARELAEVLGHAGAVVAISGASTTPTLVVVRDHLPEMRRIVTTVPGGGEGLVSWSEATDADASAFQVPVGGDDMADLMYTSGTTGRPKGVVVRHRNVAMMPNGLPQWSGVGWLHSSPMFTFAGIASVFNPMKLGLRLLYLPRFDVDRWFDVVEQRRPMATFLVPAMAELLIASPRFDNADLSSITLCPIGSAPIAPSTLARLQEKLPGAMVSNSWGMTEAGPAFCSMPPEEQSRRVGSVGRPMAPTEFRILGPDGVELPPGEDGELVVRNPGREREYFRDEEATSRTWRDGWLHTGDVAHLDEDGFLYIVGREKDVIIRGGNNIHASDVEAVLYDHPEVREAAVAGVAHAVLGEDVGAWVVRVPGSEVGEEALRAHCAERLSDYKVPRSWTFVDALPRNATGKVVTRDLPGRTPA